MRVLLICFLNFFLLKSYSQQAGYIFIENKNQWDNNINYKTDLKNGQLFVCKDGLVFDFFDEKKIEKLFKTHYTDKKYNRNKKINKHAYKVKFINANIDLISKGSQPTKGEYNYFLGDNPKKWGVNAKGFHEINYKNLYPNIDLKLYSKYFNLKYDLIVRAGGSSKDIQFSYEGVDDISIKNNRLHIITSVNHIIEDQPIAFQIINGTKKIN
jgi:hypothetical protein